MSKGPKGRGWVLRNLTEILKKMRNHGYDFLLLLQLRNFSQTETKGNFLKLTTIEIAYSYRKSLS